jgi:hypothetical protein
MKPPRGSSEQRQYHNLSAINIAILRAAEISAPIRRQASVDQMSFLFGSLSRKTM